MSDKIDVYMSLSDKGLTKTKSAARKESKETYGADDGKDELLYPDCKMKVGELYFEEDGETIDICGDVYSGEVKLGYFSLYIPVESLSKDIVENYIKKLEKVKNVIKAID